MPGCEAAPCCERLASFDSSSRVPPIFGCRTGCVDVDSDSGLLSESGTIVRRLGKRMSANITPNAAS
jgi:hypothetical protein